MVCGATALARRVPAGLVAAAALVALAIQGAGMGVQTAWAVLPVAFAGYLVGGLGHGVKNVLLRALLTARVPEAVHGRAFAAYNAARSTAELGAVGAGGVLVSALGPRAALLLAGLGPILAAVTGLIALRQRRRRGDGSALTVVARTGRLRSAAPGARPPGRIPARSGRTARRRGEGGRRHALVPDLDPMADAQRRDRLAGAGSV
jgi:hypothetical protein